MFAVRKHRDCQKSVFPPVTTRKGYQAFVGSVIYLQAVEKAGAGLQASVEVPVLEEGDKQNVAGW